MIPAVILIGWLFYSSIEGMREGFYYSCEYNIGSFCYKHTYDLHGIFSIQRAIVLSSVSLYFSGWNILFVIALFALMFPFMHDGAYYVTRKKLDGIYFNGWFDYSKTSTAWMARFLTAPNRTLAFIIGLVIYIVEFILSI